MTEINKKVIERFIRDMSSKADISLEEPRLKIAKNIEERPMLICPTKPPTVSERVFPNDMVQELTYQKAKEILTDTNVESQKIRKQHEVCKMCTEKQLKEYMNATKRWISEIHRVMDITDENGYKIELRDLIYSFEKYLKDNTGYEG